MPRVSDHAARRCQIIEAVERLIVVAGLDAVTVARTAAEAGVSVGLVQHYFSSKDQMLLHAFTEVRARIERRVNAATAAAEADHSRIEHMMVDGLAQLIPLDERRRRECRVALAFTARSLSNPELATGLRTGNARIRARLAGALRNALDCGELPEPIDYEGAAERLLAMVDGLVLHWATDRRAMPAARARTTIAAELARQLPGRCRRHDKIVQPSRSTS